MLFEEIIKKNCQESPVKWWPRFAYHYTDISNAARILLSNKLYSRIKAEDNYIMSNDNASLQVINMTQSAAKSFVRFYFRPLTPTQYYNEGYKHMAIRYAGDQNANVPVPVFFLFDLAQFMSDPNVGFSEFSQAGRGSEILKGIDAFSQLAFDKIYSKGAAEKNVLNYRHAELLYPNSYSINKSLSRILCRNEVEKETLLNMLSRKNKSIYNRYKNIISVCRQDMFEENGLFIREIAYNYDNIRISFSDTYAKRAYINRNLIDKNKELNIEVMFTFSWETSERENINTISFNKLIDYKNTVPIVFKKIPIYNNASILRIDVYIEDNCMCSVEHTLNQVELF